MRKPLASLVRAGRPRFRRIHFLNTKYTAPITQSPAHR